MEKWKDRTVDKLKDYPLQKAAMESIPLELKRLELESTAIRTAATDGVAVKTGGGRNDRMIWNIMQRQALERNLEMARQSVEFVERGLAALLPEEIETLERIYMRPERNVVEQLREEWDMAEKRSVYKRLDKMLYRLALAMYGMEAS